jgi:tRNA 2-thiouridine synthesizing protein B
MLYLINKNNHAISSCANRASDGDVVLLIEDAVFAAISNNELTFNKGVSIYALKPDMQARGIVEEVCRKRIEYVDYTGFVALVEGNNPIRSYF